MTNASIYGIICIEMDFYTLTPYIRFPGKLFNILFSTYRYIYR